MYFFEKEDTFFHGIVIPKNKRISYLALGLLLLTFFSVRAQNQPLINAKLSGRVIDAKTKEPLPGALVQIEGVTNQTQTDGDGRFHLVTGQSLPFNIIVSYIGYSKAVVKAQRSPVTVELTESVNELSSVVVVGYGTQRKRDVTGSVSSVSGEEITAYPVPNIAMGLQGKTPGVQVLQNSGEPGASVSVRIRGGNSIQGSNDPLYIVDGFALSGEPNSINPADIESIEVLKDASSTAIYGSRGANGVVIITTRQGKRGQAQINLNSYYSLQQITKKIDVLNAREFAELANERAANDGVSPYFTSDEIDAFGEGTDWQDEVYRTAPLQSHTLSVTGGSDKTLYAISGSFLGQQGIIENSDLKRSSLKANLSQKLSDEFKLDLNVALTNQKNHQISGDNGQKGNSVTSAALVAPPTLGPYNADGSYTDLIAYPFSPNGIQNPLALALSRSDVTERKSVIANPSIQYEPIKGLVFKSSVGIENNISRNDVYSPTILINTTTGQASISSAESFNFLNENTASYSKRINNLHDFNALVGFTYQKNTNKSFSTGMVSGFTTDETGTNNLSAGSVASIPSSSTSEWNLLSYLGRVNFGLYGKYLFTASVRADGSSRFGNGNKWGYFPSAAFAWRLSDEDFFKINAISDLKIRASYGITGSTALQPYQTLNLLQSYSVVFDDVLNVGYAPSMSLLANPDLKWETTGQFDIGLDATLFGNRLNITADYYSKNTRDLLQNVPLPSSTGYDGTIRNIGRVKNEGFEIGVNAVLLKKENWQWNFNGNFSRNRNTAVKLADGADLYGQSVGQPLSAAVNLIREGLPVGVFYTYVEDGLDENGAIKYKDLNDDGAITEADKTVVGNPHPDFLYNFGSTLKYNNFQLDFSFQGRKGGDIFNHNLSSVGNSLNNGENVLREVYEDHWSTADPNPNAKYPKISQSTVFQISDRYIEDGSFLRLKNVQVAYTLPLKKSAIKNLQVYLSGTNLLTFTKYSWFDPEINTRGGSNSFSLDIDQSSYPNTRLYTAGVRLIL